LDTVSVFAKDVRDCALILPALAGADPRDASSLPNPLPNLEKDLEAGVRGLKIGLPKEYLSEDVRNLAKDLEREGARIEECSLPHASYALAAHTVISAAEFASNMGKFDGLRFGFCAGGDGSVYDRYSRTRAEGFGTAVKRRILMGTYALSAGQYDAYFRRAQQARTLIIEDYRNAFAKYDVLLMPACSDFRAVGANLASLPALSMPGGVQVVGNLLCEDTVLRVSRAIEAVRS